MEVCQASRKAAADYRFRNIVAALLDPLRDTGYCFLWADASDLYQGHSPKANMAGYHISARSMQ